MKGMGARAWLALVLFCIVAPFATLAVLFVDFGEGGGRADIRAEPGGGVRSTAGAAPGNAFARPSTREVPVVTGARRSHAARRVPDVLPRPIDRVDPWTLEEAEPPPHGTLFKRSVDRAPRPIDTADPWLTLASVPSDPS